MKHLFGIIFLTGLLVFASCGPRDRDGRRAGEQERHDTIYFIENDTIPATGPRGATPGPGAQQDHELRQGEVRDDPAIQQRPRRGDTEGDDVPTRRGATSVDTLNRDLQEEGQQEVPRRRGG
jgi:hypothetical protein